MLEHGPERVYAVTATEAAPMTEQVRTIVQKELDQLDQGFRQRPGDHRASGS